MAILPRFLVKRRKLQSVRGDKKVFLSRMCDIHPIYNVPQVGHPNGGMMRSYTSPA